MTQVIAPEDLYVPSADGIHSIFIPARTPTEVPEFMLADCLKKGAVLASAVQAMAAALKPETLDDDFVLEVAEAMREILAEGNDKLLNKTDNLPRTAVIEKRVGREVSPAVKAAAAEML